MIEKVTTQNRSLKGQRYKILPYNEQLKDRARELRKNLTYGEKLIWSKIRRKACGGFEFHRQIPISEYIVDFYCHELMIAIEVDGSTHNEKIEYDKRRQKELEGFGVVVLRYTEKEVLTETQAVLDDVFRNVERVSNLKG